jgi:protocatechuate 4,5-dioxygenase alpha chain
MRERREYDDIPGTYVLDGEHSRKGYALNMFCMSLNQAENRAAFAVDEEAYVDRYDLTPEQRKAVLERDWLALLRLGGNIYYTYKLGIFDGLTYQQVAAAMSGMTGDDYVEMMNAGGRSVAGNRYVGEDRDSDRNREPDGDRADERETVGG